MVPKRGPILLTLALQVRITVVGITLSPMEVITRAGMVPVTGAVTIRTRAVAIDTDITSKCFSTAKEHDEG